MKLESNKMERLLKPRRWWEADPSDASLAPLCQVLGVSTPLWSDNRYPASVSRDMGAGLRKLPGLRLWSSSGSEDLPSSERHRTNQDIDPEHHCVEIAGRYPAECPHPPDPPFPQSAMSGHHLTLSRSRVQASGRTGGTSGQQVVRSSEEECAWGLGRMPLDLPSHSTSSL